MSPLVLTRNPVRIIFNNTEEKLLGVRIDSQLLFENHVSTFCKKACQKYMLFQELQTT